jgi:hypothetical protein
MCPSSLQDLHKGVEIQAANGKKMLALKVFSHALRFFKDHCLQELSDQSSTRIVNDDIRWVITVPAIWRQPAKQFMRQASYEVRHQFNMGAVTESCMLVVLCTTSNQEPLEQYLLLI